MSQMPHWKPHMLIRNMQQYKQYTFFALNTKEMSETHTKTPVLVWFYLVCNEPLLQWLQSAKKYKKISKFTRINKINPP